MSNLLVIDTETGGLDPQVHSILSLGAIVWDSGELRSSFEVLIAEPQLSVEPEAMRVNRINLDWHRANAVSPSEAVTRLRLFLEQNFKERPLAVPIAGHNIHFDVAFLKRLCRIAGAQYDEMFSHRVLDTAGILRFFMLADKLPITSGSSTEAFKYFGINVPPDKRHTALADAIATAELLTKLLEIAKTCSVGIGNTATPIDLGTLAGSAQAR